MKSRLFTIVLLVASSFVFAREMPEIKAWAVRGAQDSNSRWLQIEQLVELCRADNTDYKDMAAIRYLLMCLEEEEFVVLFNDVKDTTLQLNEVMGVTYGDLSNLTYGFLQQKLKLRFYNR